jgi:hypothetical protein
MDERGSVLAETLIVTAVIGLIWAAAAGVLVQIPALAARWDDAAAARQRLRVLDARVRRVATAAAPIQVEVNGHAVVVPSIWPRRLGQIRPGRQGEVSPRAVTFLSRLRAHEGLTLVTALGATGGDVLALPQRGCGSQPACGLVEGDTVLVVAADGACGLYRLEGISVRLRLAALMQPGAPAFAPGSVLMEAAIEVFEFDAAEQAVRRYDGYRSDNVLLDGVDAFSLDWEGPLADGPLVGAGPLAYDRDQLSIRAVRARISVLDPGDPQGSFRMRMHWGVRAWR